MTAGAAASGRLPRLYRDLAVWFPLVTPPADYAEEAAFYLRVFRSACARPPRTLLDLGSGGGHNASHLKRDLTVTLVDLAPAMLEVSRALNPGCEHLQGDMRTLRLGRTFDCVLVHDAISYMASRADLALAIGTAWAHCAPGGVALFQPDQVRETFAPGTDTGGSDAGARGVRWLEWRWDPDPADDTYLLDLAYLIRAADGSIRAEHDRHVLGLFARSTWLELIAAAGFTARAAPFEHGAPPAGALEVFLGLKPADAPGAAEARPLPRRRSPGR